MRWLRLHHLLRLYCNCDVNQSLVFLLHLQISRFDVCKTSLGFLSRVEKNLEKKSGELEKKTKMEKSLSSSHCESDVDFALHMLRLLTFLCVCHAVQVYIHYVDALSLYPHCFRNSTACLATSDCRIVYRSLPVTLAENFQHAFNI